MHFLGLQNALAGFINSQSLGNSHATRPWKADPNRLIDPRISSTKVQEIDRRYKRMSYMCDETNEYSTSDAMIL